MIVFLFFPENRIWHFMQIVSIGDNLHEISYPVISCIGDNCYEIYHILFPMSSAEHFTICAKRFNLILLSAWVFLSHMRELIQLPWRFLPQSCFFLPPEQMSNLTETNLLPLAANLLLFLKQISYQNRLGVQGNQKVTKVVCLVKHAGKIYHVFYCLRTVALSRIYILWSIHAIGQCHLACLCKGELQLGSHSSHRGIH